MDDLLSIPFAWELMQQTRCARVNLPNNVQQQTTRHITSKNGKITGASAYISKPISTGNSNQLP